jgi:hypothetical protein
MPSQTGTAITFSAAYLLATGAPATGLTVTVTIYRVGFGAVVTSQACTEVGSGLYSYTLSGGSTGTAGEYLAVFSTSSTSVIQQTLYASESVGQTWVQDLDATVSSRLATSSYGAPPSAAAISTQVWSEPIPGSFTDTQAGGILANLTSAEITVTSPTTSGGDFTIIRGDAYPSTKNRSIIWTITGVLASLNFATATTRFKARFRTGTIFSKTVSAVLNASTLTITLELTSTETAAFTDSHYSFDLETVFSDGDPVTWLQGSMSVLNDVR